MLAAIACVAAACHAQSSSSLPPGEVSATDTHRDPSSLLILSAPPDPNTFQVGLPLWLSLENLSQDWIWFPNDYGLSIERLDPDTGRWLPVPNLEHYYSVEQVLLSPRSQLLWATGFPVRPDPAALGTQATLRITVRGRLFQGGAITEEEIQASVECLLHQETTPAPQQVNPAA